MSKAKIKRRWNEVVRNGVEIPVPPPQDNETTGPTTYEVEAEVPKKYGGKWVVINPSLADMDEARAIQKRLKRDSGLPIRVVRVETTRTVEQGGGE